MSVQLRVLIVEDSEDDAVIMVRELRKGGYEPIFKRVDTSASMAAALAGQTWDVIIADYVMPHFDGLAAFKLSREMGFDLPFIIVSGKAGEDVAVEAMKAGVHDYVLKDKLARLVPAVVREMAEAESRRHQRRVEGELGRINRALKVLSQASQLVVHAREESALLHEVCRIAVEVGGYHLAWVGYAEDDEEKSVRPVARIGCDAEYLDTVKMTWAENELGGDPMGMAIRSGKPCITKNIVADPSYSSWRADAVKRGYASSAAFPLIADDRTFGALNIRASEWNAFDTEEVDLLAELSGVLAHGIVSLRMRAARERAEEALWESEERYRTLFNGMTEGLALHEIICDEADQPRDYRFLEVNPAFERLTGLKMKDAVGKTVLELLPRVEPFWIETYGKVALTGEPTHFEKYSREFHKHLEVFAFSPAEGRFACILSDVTGRKRAERALEIANARLREKNETLAEMSETAQRFVENVSHEFRTPLAAIKEFTAILAEGLGGPITEEQAKYLGIMGTAIQDLAQMVDDLLDTSRLKAGTLRVDRRRCRVEEIVQSVWPILLAKATAKKITLVEDVARDLPDVFADREKAGRVLINLGINAIKFSPEETQIRIWAVASDGSVEVGVTDQGPGLSDEKLKVIFGRFTQVGASTGASAKGFGLGLDIVKDLTHLNLGEVHAQSMPGRGSSFSFTLPKCDWREVVYSYLQLFAGPKEEAVVSGLEVITEHGVSLEGVRHFLATACRPMDLILGDEHGDHLVMLGRTDTPLDWAGRIRAVREQQVKDDSLLQIPEIQIGVAGMWHCPAENEKVAAWVEEQLAKGAPVG